MTVFEVISAASSGGTFCESSIAPYRPCSGGFRRPELGGERRVVVGGHAGGALGSRGTGELDGAPGWACGRSAAGPQGADTGARHGGGRLAYRSRRDASLGEHRWRVTAPGDGTIDV